MMVLKHVKFSRGLYPLLLTMRPADRLLIKYQW